MLSLVTDTSTRYRECTWLPVLDSLSLSFPKWSGGEAGHDGAHRTVESAGTTAKRLINGC